MGSLSAIPLDGVWMCPRAREVAQLLGMGEVLVSVPELAPVHDDTASDSPAIKPKATKRRRQVL
eukprot:3657803-Amphidinium_carterae.1